MSEPFDDAVKRRDLEDSMLVRDAIRHAVERGFDKCAVEFRAALQAFEAFGASGQTDQDWQALEVVVTALQRCTET